MHSINRFVVPALLVALCCPATVFAGPKDLLEIEKVSLSLTGRNVLEMNYKVLWKGKTGPEAGLVDGKCLKILGIVHELEDKDLVCHNTIFVDRFFMDIPLDASFARRANKETLKLSKAMADWNGSITAFDRVYGNERKKSQGSVLSAWIARHLAPDKNCSKNPEMTINSGVLRLKKEDVDTSNLGVSIPDEGNYWNVEEPLELSTLCWLKKDVYENGHTSKVMDLAGEIDLRYIVKIQLEDASGYQYKVEFKTQELTRFAEVKGEAKEGESGSTQKQEVVGFSGLDIK